MVSCVAQRIRHMWTLRQGQRQPIICGRPLWLALVCGCPEHSFASPGIADLSILS